MTSRQKHQGKKNHIAIKPLSNKSVWQNIMIYLNYSIKESISKDTNRTSGGKAMNYYELASAQGISFPWTLPEESVIEGASCNKNNLRSFGIRTRSMRNIVFYRIKANGCKNIMAVYSKNINKVQVSKTEKYNKLTGRLIGIYSVYKDTASAVVGWEAGKKNKVSSWFHYFS